MREKAAHIQRPKGIVFDTCGTGGDNIGTFNVSTTAAFIVAAAGIPVAKHGNRAMSSRCGSADVLTALGVRIDCPHAVAERCLAEIGICFLFAPAYHSAMKHAVQPRREIGHRTIFNLAGPLSNPAGASHQLIGVYDRSLCRMFAEVLRELGSERVLIVHGSDGLDEISTTEVTELTELRNGDIYSWSATPSDFGIETPADMADLLAGEDAEANAAIVTAILKGDETGPKAEIALVNAGAALYVAGKAESIPEGVKAARQMIASGAAYAKLEALCEMTIASEDMQS
jgi:anthranilate phosphoribosyltransferase